jgi:hypothetical protein
MKMERHFSDMAQAAIIYAMSATLDNRTKSKCRAEKRCTVMVSASPPVRQTANEIKGEQAWAAFLKSTGESCLA